MKVANIIIAHKNPAQVLQLINQYDEKLFHNFVHVDSKCRMEDWQDVVMHPGVTMAKRRWKMVYAGFGFVGATLDALREIKKSQEHFFYINLISGQDFPLQPTQRFYDFLRHTYETQPKEFFEILDLSVWPGAHRYQQFHLIEWTARGRYFIERWINKFIPKRKFYDGKFVPYGRAAWFTASDHFVNYALEYLKEHPDYIRFLKTCWSPDEFIFNTLVMNSPFREHVAPYLRYIDWSEGKVTPMVFRTVDVDRLLSSGCFMARKFDQAVDGMVLDNLEEKLQEDRKERKSSGGR